MGRDQGIERLHFWVQVHRRFAPMSNHAELCCNSRSGLALITPGRLPTGGVHVAAWSRYFFSRQNTSRSSRALVPTALQNEKRSAQRSETAHTVFDQDQFRILLIVDNVFRSVFLNGGTVFSKHFSGVHVRAG